MRQDNEITYVRKTEKSKAKVVSRKTTEIGGGIEKKWRHVGYMEMPKVKNFLDRLFRRQRRKKVSLIERNLTFLKADIFVLWEAFKKAGLPVVPTMRKTDRGTVVMTDMKANGAEIYGRGMNIYKDGGMEIRRAKGLLPIDKVFLRIYPKIKEQIRKESERIAILATNAAIDLPNDDPFELIVNPDGTWQLCALDLALADIHEKEKWLYKDNEHAQSRMRKQNLARNKGILIHIEELYQKLSAMQ